MPFSRDEIDAMERNAFDRMERLARRVEKQMWKKHEDDLVGIPDIDRLTYWMPVNSNDE